MVSCISRCLPVHAFESLLLAWTRWLRPKCFLIAFPQVSWTWPVSSQHVETTAQQVWRYCTALWGRAGLGHRGDMLSLHPSVCRWFSSALLFSEQQIGSEQGLSTLLGSTTQQHACSSETFHFWRPCKSVFAPFQQHGCQDSDYGLNNNNHHWLI